MKIAIIFHPRRMRATEELIHGSRRKVIFPTLARVRKAFQRVGHKVVSIDGRGDLITKVRRTKPEIVFNWFSVPGRAQTYVPAILEKMEVPYTGCGSLSHALAMHKGLSSKILRYDKLPIPPFSLVSRKQRQPSQRIKFPVLVKPCSLGASEGITMESFVESAEELSSAIDTALVKDKEAVITKFIPGRELTVGIIGNEKLQILPILEKHFRAKPGIPHIFTEKMKRTRAHWHESVSVPNLPEQEDAAVRKQAMRAYRSIRCTDYARVDIRLDKRGIPWIIEVNTLPGIFPKFSPMTKMANEIGKGVEYLSMRILEEAIARYGL
ncbi:MAG: ATP-grasp domain-containing protein [Desulfobacteraceae bacterium]|nr:ATP-grasp domain-containing protein [Desulfobacteraceae bacterium]